MNFGRKKWSRTQMRSAKGTAYFRTLSVGRQRQWAAFDSKGQRRAYKKMGY